MLAALMQQCAEEQQEQQQRQQERQQLGLQMAVDAYANARVSLPLPFAAIRDQLLLGAAAPGVGAAALSVSPPSPALTPTGPPASQLSSSQAAAVRLVDLAVDVSGYGGGGHNAGGACRRWRTGGRRRSIVRGVGRHARRCEIVRDRAR